MIISDELRKLVPDVQQKQVDLDRVMQRTLAQLERNEKPHHDFTKLMKTQMDLYHLQIKLLESVWHMPAPFTWDEDEEDEKDYASLTLVQREQNASAS